MAIKIRHYKNPSRDTEKLTYATIPIEEAKNISESGVKKMLAPYYPKANFGHITYLLNELASLKGNEHPFFGYAPMGDYKTHLSFRKGKKNIKILPTPVVHDIRDNGVPSSSSNSFENLLNTLKYGFKAYGSGPDNAYAKEHRKYRFTGWGIPSKQENITKNDTYSIELFPDKAYGEYKNYHIERAQTKEISSINIKLNPESSDEDREKKMQFYKQEIAEKYHIPVKFFFSTADEQNPPRILPKKERLEHKLTGIIALGGLCVGFFFISSNLTGNVIGNLNQTSSNFIGGILFIVGLVGAFFYFRKK